MSNIDLNDDNDLKLNQLTLDELIQKSKLDVVISESIINPSSRLEELLEKCGKDFVLSESDKEWLNIAPVGKEIF